MALNGEVIKQRLKETFSGESQEMVAKKLNMTQGSISKLITGKQLPTLECLYHIADIYEVSVDWIIGLSESKRNVIPDEKHMASYSDVAFAVSELVSVEGALIDEASDDFTLIIKDPMAKALILKGITLSRTDSELYKSWLINKLPMFDDKELIEGFVWEEDILSLQASANLTDNGWLIVHDEAIAKRDEFYPFR